MLPRFKPDPLPPIRAVPEHVAEGALKARYEDTKSVLGVPWMGVVAMAFAHYPNFYDTLWHGLRALCLSAPFRQACRDLRAEAEAGVPALDPPPLVPRLVSAWYAPREIEAIRAVLDIFSQGNFPYLLLATVARLLLEGGELSEGRQAPPAPADESDMPSRAAFVLMEEHHADAPMRALYGDLKATLGLPFVNTDYRALARWPSYFALAWMDLKPKIGTPAYDAVVADMHAHACRVAAALPNPGALSGEALRRAAARDADPDEVLAVVRLFQWLLPGLVTNVAFFRAQLV